MRVWSCLFVVILLALTSPGRADGPYPKSIKSTIAGLQYVGQEDFEKKSPGLGRRYAYSSDAGRLDVFIYAAGLNRPPSARDVSDELEQATADVVWAGQQGLLSNLEGLDDFSLKTGKTTARCRAFSLARKDLGDVWSYLCVSSAYGQFLKVRLSVKTSSGREAAARGILTEALRAFAG